MKKLILFAAALIMAVSFNSCTSKEESSTTTNNPSGGWGGNTGGGSGTGDNNTGGNTQSQTTRIIRRIVETQKTEYSDSYGVHTFEYDAQNRITNWTSQYGQTTITHTYSYNGNKVYCYTLEDYGVYGKEPNESYITLNSDGYAIRIENVYNIDRQDYYDWINMTYQNGYIQYSNETWPDSNGYMNTEFTWDNGNLTGTYSTLNEVPEDMQDIIIRVSYKYNLSREAVPVNIDLTAFIDFADFYDWNASLFFYGKQSKNLLTRIDDETIYLGSSNVSNATCTFDYKFNSDGTIASFTTESENYGNRTVTTYDITYY